ncbi:hypothetical protein PV10_05050 [Exophiala mesophila]|uniref:Uncharacterized protein n=1 Tax=Exophiala mesophila TaxID=212818 RepID=A0A0D2A4G6_EXOME|nr:uncharacterized protein PV10_05050 [Exophiala mesophila]KIV93868.1 hypothetical protein PV10_05050 [Exophiala mesophila]
MAQTADTDLARVSGCPPGPVPALSRPDVHSLMPLPRLPLFHSHQLPNSSFSGGETSVSETTNDDDDLMFPDQGTLGSEYPTMTPYRRGATLQEGVNGDGDGDGDGDGGLYFSSANNSIGGPRNTLIGGIEHMSPRLGRQRDFERSNAYYTWLMASQAAGPSNNNNNMVNSASTSTGSSNTSSITNMSMSMSIHMANTTTGIHTLSLEEYIESWDWDTQLQVMNQSATYDTYVDWS